MRQNKTWYSACSCTMDVKADCNEHKDAVSKIIAEKPEAHNFLWCFLLWRFIEVWFLKKISKTTFFVIIIFYFPLSVRYVRVLPFKQHLILSFQPFGPSRKPHGCNALHFSSGIITRRNISGFRLRCHISIAGIYLVPVEHRFYKLISIRSKIEIAKLFHIKYFDIIVVLGHDLTSCTWFDLVILW